MRPSGRRPDQMRDVRFTPRFTRHAEGSVLAEFGQEPMCDRMLGLYRELEDGAMARAG